MLIHKDIFVITKHIILMEVIQEMEMELYNWQCCNQMKCPKNGISLCTTFINYVSNESKNEYKIKISAFYDGFHCSISKIFFFLFVIIFKNLQINK